MKTNNRMHASCPSCKTRIVGSRPPDECPYCGESLGAGCLRPHTIVDSVDSVRWEDAVVTLKTPEGFSVEHPLAERLWIGRHNDNDLVIEDIEVSKRHAVIERSGGSFVMRDLGSSNGTFVNGVRTREATLLDGDQMRVGRASISFSLPGTHEGEAFGGQKNLGRVALVQSGGMGSVIASARPRPLTDADDFVPAERVEDVDSLRADYERLRIAYRFNQEGGLITAKKNDLFGLILKLALEWLPADNGVLLVPDEQGAFCPVLAESRDRDAGISVSRTLIEQVIEVGEGILSSDAVVDRRFAGIESMVGRGVRSVLAVPVVVRENIRAIVYLDSMSQANAFTPKDLDIVTSIASQAALAMLNQDLIQRVKKEEATRSHLERFLSPALVHKAACGELDLKKGGTLVKASILFSDIRGFTSMSERLPAEEVVKLLNEHFEDMVEVVFDYQGVLDKFLGDSVMAIWGVPILNEDDATRAVRAAVEMQRRVSLMNERLAGQDMPAMSIGIGISTGECVVGNMGSSRRLEYTAIGDTVNLASRICGLAGPGEIVVSEQTHIDTKSFFRTLTLPPKHVKGKSRPVSLYRIEGYLEENAESCGSASESSTSGVKSAEGVQ